MALTLSEADIDRIEAALTALVSPLTYRDPTAWRHAIVARCSEVLGADQAISMMPLAGEPIGVANDANIAAAGDAYEDYYWQLDTGLTHRRRELGLEVFNRDHIYGPGSGFRVGELFNDWCVPYRLLDPIAMDVQLGAGPLPTGIHFYHDTDEAHPFGERGLALLRILFPAFKAGVLTCMRLRQHRADLMRALDTMAEPLAIVAIDGRLVHANPALTTTLADDPEGARILAAMRQAAAALLSITSAGSTTRATVDESQALLREFRTGRGRYRVRASALSLGLVAPIPSALIAVEHVAPAPLSDAELRQRFRLTAREVAVARLLAEGRSNAEVAQALAASVRTAEHHTEHVLLKLGVHSRAAVGAALRGERTPNG